MPQLSILSMPELNKKIWGIGTRRLTLIGARTSHGKSAFAMQTAYDFAKQGHAVLFLSLEMSVEDVLERLFCMTRKINNRHLVTGRFEEYVSQWASFINEIDDLPLVISDFIGKDWKDIDDTLKGLTVKPKVVVLDYIQNVNKMGFNAKESMDDYIRSYRTMSIRHDFAAVMCSQINRCNEDAKNKTPSMHQLKGTGFLEEHSDIVMLLHWVSKQDASADLNDYMLYIAKNRYGCTGSVKLKFYPEHYLFTDYDHDPNHQGVLNEFNKVE